jgi:hypothetical protein
MTTMIVTAMGVILITIDIALITHCILSILIKQEI